MSTAKSKRILDQELLAITIDRLCYQLIENHNDFQDSVIIGLQPRGVFLSRRIYERIKSIKPDVHLKHGELDISFFRDDFRRREMIVPSSTRMDFIVEGKKVILVDDVLFTGRTIRAALDALCDLGRPKIIQLAVLVDRGHRELPIRPDFVGKNLPTSPLERVRVRLAEMDGEDAVVLEKEKA